MADLSVEVGAKADTEARRVVRRATWRCEGIKGVRKSDRGVIFGREGGERGWSRWESKRVLNELQILVV